MSKTPQQKISIAISIISIVVPLLIIIKNIPIGVGLLLIGAIVSRRAMMLANKNDPQLLSDADIVKFGRHQSERSQTILVQVVDDNGYDLPPEVIAQKMTEAKLRASPRDTIVAIRHKINKDH